MNPLIETAVSGVDNTDTAPGYSQPYDTRQGPRPIVLLWTASILVWGEEQVLFSAAAIDILTFVLFFKSYKLIPFINYTHPYFRCVFIYYVIFFFNKKEKKNNSLRLVGV